MPSILGTVDPRLLRVVVIVLYGPKGAGKSQVAGVLRDRHGVDHVDADALVLGLVEAGVRPRPRRGWLAAVEHEVGAALTSARVVSVEATGAWDSDWQLADELEAAGARVVRVWVEAPVEVTLERLTARTGRKVPVSSREARRIHAAASAQAEHRRFDVRLDTGSLDEAELPNAVEAIATYLH
jgi:dephospho-CoA kinase